MTEDIFCLHTLSGASLKPKDDDASTKETALQLVVVIVYSNELRLVLCTITLRILKDCKQKLVQTCSGRILNCCCD